MKRAFLFSSGITAIVVGVFTLAYLTSAATNKFPFTGRGIVREHDSAGKNMRVYFTQLSGDASNLALGTARDVSVGQAKMFKRDAKGKLGRVNQGNFGIGDEVSLQGMVRSDDRFVATKIIGLDTSFVMVGKLKTFDNSNNRMTIEVTSSTYRPSLHVKKILTFLVSKLTKFYSGGRDKPKDDVTASDQKVRVEGKVVNGTEFEVSSMNENVP